MTLALAMCRMCWGLRADEAGAPCLECNARGFTGGLPLAPPVLPRICDACDGDEPHHGGCEGATDGCACERPQCALERKACRNPRPMLDDAHDSGCLCPACCDEDDDAPSAADLRWGDMEADQDAIRSACRRGL